MQQEKSLMLEAAILYYEQKLTQQEIARRMGLTRQTVSKFLSEAVDEKVVEILAPIQNTLSKIPYSRKEYNYDIINKSY